MVVDEQSVPNAQAGCNRSCGDEDMQFGCKHPPNCKGSQIHQTARLGLPQWCDQQFKKNHGQFCFSWPSIHLFATLGKQLHFGSLFGGRPAGVAYPVATRQGNTKSKCDVAHTDSPKSARPHDTPHQFWFRCVFFCGFLWVQVVDSVHRAVLMSVATRCWTLRCNAHDENADVHAALLPSHAEGHDTARLLWQTGVRHQRTLSSKLYSVKMCLLRIRLPMNPDGSSRAWSCSGGGYVKAGSLNFYAELIPSLKLPCVRRTVALGSSQLNMLIGHCLATSGLVR